MNEPTIRLLPVRLLACSGFLLGGIPLWSQAPGVPIYESEHRPGGDQASEEGGLLKRLEELRKEGVLLEVAKVRAQLGRTAPVPLRLPAPETRPLAPSAVWEAARANYLRIGYYYLCGSCSNWHLNLSGGYVIAPGGVAATCHHVVSPEGKKMTEAYLVAADDLGNAYPVTELLAGNAATDVAILKTGAEHLKPRSLNTLVRPGDPAFLFSDPRGNRGYFSQGIVNRFVRTGAGNVVRMNVGTDWAPGSSGAAVLDACGNAIGHVSTISTIPLRREKPGEASAGPAETVMVIHTAVRAADVLALVAAPSGQP